MGEAGFCSRCGSALVADAAFCMQCGAPAGAALPAPDAWTAPPADRPRRRRLFALGLVAVLVLAVAAAGIMLAVSRSESSFKYDGVFVPAGEAPAAVAPIVLTDGRCLLVSGGPVAGTTVWLFDPATHRIDPIEGAAIRSTFPFPGFATADGGAILFVILDPTAKVFDPKTRTLHDGPTAETTFSSVPPLPLKDGRVLLLGGGEGMDYYLYDASTGSSGTIRPLAQTSAHPWPAVAQLADGRILAVGGLDSRAYKTIDEAELLTLDGDVSPAGSLVEGRFMAALVTLRDGRVLVAGGYGGDFKPLASAEVYDPKAGAFRAIDSMRHAASPATVLLRDGRVLLADNATTENVQIFDPKTNAFTSGGSFPVDVTDPSSTSSLMFRPTLSMLPDGRVLVVSGKKLFIYH